MNDFLFKEFPEVSSKLWKQKIQVDLKGADYNETLIWKTAEGIDVKPFYHQDEQKEFHKIAMPDSWNIAQKVYVNNSEKANKKALDIISRGGESIIFQIPEESVDIKKLLSEIELQNIHIHLDMGFLSISFIEKLKSIVGNNDKIYLHIDIIGNLARSGNWYHNKEKDHQLFEEIIKLSDFTTTNILIDTTLYQNAGASITQQLAYALAHAHEYLNHFSQKGVLPKFGFRIAVGANYFFEIAKIRALKLLWNTISEEYGIAEACHIIAVPSKRNKTLYDYNVNMLRTTTEIMSAVLGGANTVCNMPYDVLYHKDNEFGERISRNQLLILKKESYFDKVINPADGSYFIENLTEQLAEKALDVFKNIEAGGGFLSQLKNGIIQRKINESADAEQKEFDNGEKILLGTNKHPNPNDKMKNELELYPFVKTDQRKTIIIPIIEKRLAEKLEKARLEDE